jgi:hypothetical protein
MSFTSQSPGGPPGPEDQRGWWRRVGAVGQVSIVAALIGVIGAVVPAVLALRGSGGLTMSANNGNGSATVSTTGTRPPATAATTAKRSAAPIRFSISDRLTEGCEEETIAVALEGQQVADLHATRANPVVTKTVQATVPGNYSYVLDAAVIWIDDSGVTQRTVTTGRSSVYIKDGTRLEVYLHLDNTGGLSLSLETAG